jgi:hypothetical protein
MPRQPLLPVFRDAKLRFPINVLEERPEMSGLIGQCVGLWAQIEIQMALILSALMKSHFDAAIAVFLSIRNSRQQQEALAAAAQTTLVGRASEIFSAISNVYRSLESQRNDLVHGVYALSDDLPNALLWVDPKNHTNFFANLFEKIKNDNPVSIDQIKKDTFVYRPNDLATLIKQMDDLCFAAMVFATNLRAR